MSSVFSQFHQVINDIKPLLDIYLPDMANNALDLSREKVNERTLSILLYGAYNAGKSTLVNVLLGRNEATVGEIPTTDHVSEFNWNDYKLLDSPGVNAPIEHEKITLDRLEKTDLVVFVIRQDDQDVKDIYDRIFSCITKKKHVFIVLNYNGLDPNSIGEGSVEILVNQINKILLEEAKKHQIIDSELNKKISILPINLKTALKGKLENKKFLLEHSGYNNFIIQFYEWVKYYDNEYHFVDSIKTYLNNFLISPVQNVLNEKISESSKQQDLSRKIHQLEIKKNTIIGNTTSQLRAIVVIKKKGLFNQLSGLSNEIELEFFLEKYINDIEQDFNQWFIQQNHGIQEQLLSGVITNNNLLPDDENNSYVFEKFSSLGTDILKNDSLVKDGLVEGLKLLRSNKIAFKGIWVKTFEKWAGKATPIISIIATVFDAYQSGKKEEEHNQKRKSYIMQLHQIIDSISNDVINNLIDTVKNNVNNIFGVAIQTYKNELDDLNKNSTVVENHYSDLQLIINKLEEINVF